MLNEMAVANGAPLYPRFIGSGPQTDCLVSVRCNGYRWYGANQEDSLVERLLEPRIR